MPSPYRMAMQSMCGTLVANTTSMSPNAMSKVNIVVCAERLTAETDISVPISTTLPKASSLSAANVRLICQWVSLLNLITLVSLFL